MTLRKILPAALLLLAVFTILNIAVLVPIPSASVNTAIRLKPALFRSERMA